MVGGGEPDDQGVLFSALPSMWHDTWIWKLHGLDVEIKAEKVS